MGLIAVKQADVAKIVSGLDPNNPEAGDQWMDVAANKPLILKSDFTLQAVGRYLPDVDPTVDEVQTVHIDALGDGTLAAHLVSTTKTDKDGNATVTPTPTTYVPPATTTNTTPTVAPVATPAAQVAGAADNFSAVSFGGGVLVALGVMGITMLMMKAMKK